MPDNQNGPQFVEDLFIVDIDPGTNKKVVYHVPEKVWKALQPERLESNSDDPVIARLIPLLRSEVVLADVPEKEKEPGYYLTDLTTLAANID